MIFRIIKTLEFRNIFQGLANKCIEEILSIASIDNSSLSFIIVEFHKYKCIRILIDEIYANLTETYIYEILINSYIMYNYCRKSKNEKTKLNYMTKFVRILFDTNIAKLVKILEFKKNIDYTPVIIENLNKCYNATEDFMSEIIYHIYEIQNKLINDNFKKYLIQDLINIVQLYAIN
jgi:hypothetical protein